MLILLANDDGIDAPGLAFLADAVRRLGHDPFIVAPERKWTAASHHLSFDRDIALTKRGERVHACSGTPADCIVAAMTVLFDGARRPDLVLSGVNDGRNTAEDAAYSGTLSIAREATFWGVPAIGFSRVKEAPMGEPEVEAFARMIERLWRARAEWLVEGGWLSVNLPRVLPAPVALARIGHDKIASEADIVSRDDGRILWRIRRGRPRTSTAEDENSHIDAGRISIVRHRWNRHDPLPEGLLTHLQR